MPSALTTSIRTWMDEPAVPDPPRRVWRDWALVVVVSIGAVCEAVLRVDHEWVDLPLGWRIAAVVVFSATAPAALLVRRIHPLGATAVAFGAAMGFGVATAIFEGPFGGLVTMSVVLVVPYALYRWGSGRDGAIGIGILLASWVVGNAADTGINAGDWIGGFIVLSIPVEAGLLVRYRSAARDRAVREAQSSERVALARELHDTVAHHVSAIAVQAQAARAVAESDPDRALDVLGVIEDQASRTLAEMRAMVGTLRDGDDPDLAPQPGVADLASLADSAGALAVTVTVDEAVPDLEPAVDSAVFRIAQESVTNAVRHARRASRVTVDVAVEADAVSVTVVDDGESPAEALRGFGLTGMAERVHLLGGVFDAGPDGGRGWRVAAQLPRSGTVGDRGVPR